MVLLAGVLGPGGHTHGGHIHGSHAHRVQVHQLRSSQMLNTTIPEVALGFQGDLSRSFRVST